MNPFEILNLLRRKESNPFRELSRVERFAQHQKEIEVKEGIKRMGIICNDILIDQRYAEFAEIFKNIEKQLLDLMIDCEESDRDRYFLKMREYQLKLRMFRQILRMPREFTEEAEKIKNETR